MQQADKIKVFETEVNYIENEQLRILAQRLVEQLPDYFFEVAASSSGKYHPNFALGNGGLVRHTKAAVRVAVELIRLEQYSFLMPARDYIIIALILHDGLKHGHVHEDGTYADYTVKEHAVLAANWVRAAIGLCTEEVLNYIADLILTHMGEWNFHDRTGTLTAPKPQTQEQCFVHMCDYLASRKCMEINSEETFVS